MDKFLFNVYNWDNHGCGGREDCGGCTIKAAFIAAGITDENVMRDFLVELNMREEIIIGEKYI